MHPKTEEKEKAVKLRQNGRSLNEISRMLGVAKSSVSVWCRNICLTEDQLAKLKKEGAPGRKLGSLANKVKRQKEVVAIRKNAKKEFGKLNINDLERLKDIGTVIYWAEGRKRDVVDVTNSDPEMIKIAMRWFREICNVNETKFKASIYYHFDQNEQKIKEYWATVTGIPLKQFNKSIFKKEGTGHRKNILYNGTCKIVICDRNLLHRILSWIEQLYL